MQDPRIKGTIYEQMLSNPNDTNIKFDTQTSKYKSPFVDSYLKDYNEVQNIYGETKGAAQKGAEASSDYQRQDYENAVKSLNAGLESDVRNLSNTSASRGAFGSSAYQDQMKSLQNTYTPKYADTYNKASYGATTQGMEQQGKLGYNPYNPQFTKYSPNISGNTLTPEATGNTYKYNPFQQRMGSIERANKFANSQI